MMCSNRAANSSSSRTIFVFFFCGGCFCRLNRGGGGGIVVVVVVFIVAFFFFSSLKSSSLSSSSSFGRDRKDISLKTIFTDERERCFCVHFLPSFSLQRIKSLSGALDSFVVDEWPFFSVVNERKDFFTSRASRRRKKIFSRKPPSSLSFPHTFFRFCCVILVYTPVYKKPPHEDANFHTGFISNNFKKMSTTTANPPASAAATKGTR